MLANEEDQAQDCDERDYAYELTASTSSRAVSRCHGYSVMPCSSTQRPNIDRA